MPAFQWGPLVLPWQLLLVLATAVLTSFVGKRAGRKLDLDLEPLLFRVALVAVIGARLAFVWQFRAAYFKSPLDILDIRDGGWSPDAGLALAWLCALALSRRRPVVRRPLLMAMLAGSAVWLAGSVALGLVPANGSKMPVWTLQALDGSPVGLSSFEGRPTVVNLWATWCPPCQREMPVLRQAQLEHPEINFVFLNQGESAEKVRQYLQRSQLVLRNVLLDPKAEMGSRFDQKALPTTLFFDARGQFIGTRIGALSRATLAQRLDSLSPPTGSR